MTNEIKNYLPQPVDEANPGLVDFYYFAWEKAFEHIRSIPGMKQNPYMDEGFCDTLIWIWDTSFMSLFCKYAQKFFPGVESFQNFYHVLYDHGTLGKIQTSQSEPEWTGAIPGAINPVLVHNADNPPLFAWAEYENALFSGDEAHVREILIEKKYLQKHYSFLENLMEKHIKIPGVRIDTRWCSGEKGYFWDGGSCGMDNSPRGRKGNPPTLINRPNNPDMYYIDAIAQQALSARSIAGLADMIGERVLAEEWLQRYDEKKRIVNELYWDPVDQYYYDIDCHTLKPMKVMTLASVWTLTSGIASPDRARMFAEKLQDPQKFGGFVPWVTLARDDGDFNVENGCYWRGSVWMPTAYAGLRGLLNYNLFDIASSSAKKLLNHLYRTWIEYDPHTIWEAYSPSAYEPARSCDENNRIVRPDFCGWSALGPISIYIEFILGFHTIDAFRKKIIWETPADHDRMLGIRNLHFETITTDIVAKHGRADVKSDGSYTLVINGQEHPIHPGEQTISYSSKQK